MTRRMNFCRLTLRRTTSTAANRSLEWVTCEQSKSLGVIGKNLAAFATARDADVKLLLMDGSQRTGRRHDQNLIHRGLAHLGRRVK